MTRLPCPQADRGPRGPDRGVRGSGLDLVRLYLRQIGAVPLLTAAEEVELAKRIEAGVYAEELLRAADAGERCLEEGRRRDLEVLAHDGHRAREHLIRANLRLVVTVARRCVRRGMPLMDAVQEGNIGLMRAVEKFDYTKGCKFSTYAAWWIRQALQRGAANQARVVRLPVHIVAELDRLRSADRQLTVRLGRASEIEELAAEAGMSVPRVIELRRAGRDAMSLDRLVGDDADTRIGDLFEDITAPSAPEAAERQALAEDVRTAVAHLPPEQARVIARRYGLRDGHYHTLEDVSAELRVSRERVRRLERTGLTRLRESERDRLLDWVG
ncbi:MAG: sigma-70 family RNA polymerase sigma factor [Actinophytocola sp.]|nr:sigma-70 family RNA polymerase sigma factor [Actinophytocola sp.]